MTPLSPLDALGPAFRRTREVLAQPFRLGFFLKIALLAALTQPSFYSASISYPVQGVQVAAFPRIGHHVAMGLPAQGSNFQSGAGMAAAGIIALLILLAVGFVIWVGVAYLYCRLRFTVFDLVVSKRGRVRQAWSRYGRQAWRYLGLVVLVALGFLTLGGIVVGPTLVNFIRVIKPLIGSMGAGHANVNPFPLLGAMLPFLLAIFAVGILWAVADALMQDFLLPPMALEDAPLESALQRFFALLKTDFGPVVLYILLRFAVGIGLTWLLMLIVLIALALVGLTLFAVGMVLYHALWASVLGQVLCVALGIVAGLMVLVIYAIAVVSIYGIAAIFKQSYAAYFFGGRYPQLGDKLEPPPPLPAVIEEAEVSRPLPSMPPDLPPLGDAPPVW